VVLGVEALDRDAVGAVDHDAVLRRGALELLALEDDLVGILGVADQLHPVLLVGEDVHAFLPRAVRDEHLGALAGVVDRLLDRLEAALRLLRLRLADPEGAALRRVLDSSWVARRRVVRPERGCRDGKRERNSNSTGQRFGYPHPFSSLT